MKESIALFATLFALCAAGPTPVFLSSYFSAEDRQNFLDIFHAALETKADDVAALHYAAAGIKLLGGTIDATVATKACDRVKQVDTTDLKNLYHAASAAEALPNCALATVKGAPEAINGAAAEAKPTSLNLFYALEAARKLVIKVNQADFARALEAAFKDDAPNNYAFALGAASQLDKPSANKFFGRITDFLALADEVDGKYMQFEGGLSVTALAVHSIYELAEKVGKAPPLKPEEVVKFTNYLLSRKSVQVERPAFLLSEALTKLAKNPYHIPVTFAFNTPATVLDDGKTLKVRVANVLGASTGSLNVLLDSVTHAKTGKSVVAKKQFSKDPSDKTTNTLYLLDLQKDKLDAGFYNAQISLTGQDKKLIGTTGAQLAFKVPTEVSVEEVQFAVYERELKGAEETFSIPPGKKHVQVPKVNTHQKIQLKFLVKDKATGVPRAVHQAFVALVNEKTRQEVIYVAEPEATTKLYTFELDMHKNAKDFAGVSGTYHVQLILGDALLQNPVDWNVVDVAVEVPEVPAPVVKKSEKIVYEKLPEIKHQFREPEQLPPSAVSHLFTAICAAPIALLLVLWWRVGLNLGNMPISLWTLGFHAGLAAIFGLYFVFWLQLNMFTTLKYLTIIAIPTFFCGNRLLRSLALARTQRAAQ
ncbi:ribophorin II [Aphelenchoides avenae]|nr:ribophorin II [Aphelenchus avenae]